MPKILPVSQTIMKFRNALLLTILTLTLAACGGGGSDSGGSVASVVYSGSVSQAAVTAQNAEPIAEAVAKGTMSSGSVGATGGIGVIESGSGEGLSAYWVAGILSQTVIDAVDNNSSTLNYGLSEQLSEVGDCGGTLTGSLTINESTFDLSGTFYFNGFCHERRTINGSINLSGNLFTSFSMTFTSVTFSSAGESVTMNGSFTTSNLSVSGMRVTMNLDARNNNTGETIRMSNYIVDYLIGASSMTMDIVSGTFYDPTNGYVSVVTTSPLVQNYADAYPSSGTIVATGTGNSKVRLVVLSSTQVLISADADGNGTYEYGPVTRNWADL